MKINISYKKNNIIVIGKASTGKYTIEDLSSFKLDDYYIMKNY
jgi:hypothetical protein